MARVELDHIAKRYPGGVTAVRSISMTIEDGEFIVLVGPSGCGKSTTLRMLAGLETISSGELRIDGQRVNELPPRKRDVAMVFQSYALYPHMTVFENMAFGLRIQKVPEAEILKRVTEAAERLDITSVLDRKPGQMSGGQQQRVAMGRAIVRRPKIFLFDEPLSNLDARLRSQMRVEISRLHKSLDATSIYVTHDQVEAMTLADRIVLLQGGEVQQVGPPLALYSEPANEFVATFIGHPTMNVFDGELVEGQLCCGALDLGFVERGGVQGKFRVGIRPHHIQLCDVADPGAFAARVDVIEPMGHETLLYCVLDGLRLVAVAQGLVHLTPGDLVHLVVDTEHLHLFDPHEGARV